jgi:uncharacterized protein DUF6093
MTFGNPFEAWVPYNPDNDSGGYFENETVTYEGKARVQQISNGADIQNLQVFDPTSEVLMRVQVPLAANSGKITRGWQIRVIDGGNDGALTSAVLYVDTAVNSNWAQVRDIHCTYDYEKSQPQNPEIE